MKILHFSGYISIIDKKSFNRSMTGYGFMCFDIPFHISKYKVNCHLLTQSGITTGEKYDNLLILNRTFFDIFINIKLIDFINAIKVIYRYSIPLKYVKNIFLYHISMGYAVKIIKKFNYDIIHIHDINFYTYPLISLCEKYKFKYTVTIHGLNSFSDSIKKIGKLGDLERDILSNLLRKNIKFTVISSGIKNKILSYFNQDKTNLINIITNGIDIKLNNSNNIDIRKKYNIGQDKKIMLCVGNFGINKNQLQVCKAFLLLPDSIKDNLTIFFLGKENFNEISEIELNYFKSFKNLIFCGFIPREDIYNYYIQADFNIVASISEGFGLSFIEAFNFGIPSVTFSDIDSISDIYDKEAMILVNERDDFQLAEGIKFIYNKQWNKQYIINHSRQFKFEKISKEYIAFYKKLNLTNLNQFYT